MPVVSEHRYTIPCQLDPEEAEQALADPIEAIETEGWEAIPHIETVGFFGWTLRAPDERAVGVSVPQPGGPETLMVRSDHEALAERVVDALTSQGPLEGAQATRSDTGKEPLRGP